MAALNRNLRAAFVAATDSAGSDDPEVVEANNKALREAYARLGRVLQQNLVPGATSTAAVPVDVLVLGAEAAIANENFAMADNAVHSFYLRDPPRNQFYCRALFVSARVAALPVGLTSRSARTMSS